MVRGRVRIRIRIRIRVMIRIMVRLGLGCEVYSKLIPMFVT